MPRTCTEFRGKADMSKTEFNAIEAVILHYIDEFAKIEEHVRSADLGWFRNLAVQEWYSSLLELVTRKPSSEGSP